MQTIDMHGTFEEAIARTTPELQELARDVRTLIAEVYPQVVEVPWPNQQITGYGLGPKKMSEHFCYIAVHGQHVNLGFNYGADLPDPQGLLQGTGKMFRHVKIAQREQIRQTALHALIEAAIRERERALGRTRA
jgi:hypothetical protein